MAKREAGGIGGFAFPLRVEDPTGCVRGEKLQQMQLDRDISAGTGGLPAGGQPE